MTIEPRSTTAGVLLMLALAACAPAGDQADPAAPTDPTKLQLPAPTGPHAIGVVDFELVDDNREETFDPGRPRRIPVRAWFPAASVSGQPRLYMKSLELEHHVRAFAERMLPMSEAAMKAREGLVTHAYESAVPASDGPVPTLIFSHGGFAHPQSNTALMEHLASHGYLVLSITHPYLSSATLHESGDIIPADQGLIDGMMAAATDEDYLAAYVETDLAVTLEASLRNNETFVLSPHFLEWEQDFVHVIDRLSAGDLPDQAQLLLALVDRDRLGTFGMSFGASGSAAGHKDPRVKAAVNLDGGVFDSALFDVDVRMPVLVMHSDHEMAIPGRRVRPHSQFVYERFEAAGTRDDVIRVETKGSTHIAYTDAVLTPASVRNVDSAVAASLGTIDGQRMATIMNEFVRRFFDFYLSGAGDGLDAAFRARFPEVIDVDLSDVRAWAATNPEPGFMSYTHVFRMNRLLAGDPDVRHEASRLDRRYVMAYELANGPKGNTVWWQMAFDPVAGVSFSLQAPTVAPDLTFRGDYSAVIGAMRDSQTGQQPELPVEPVGDETLMETIGAVFAEGQRAATIKSVFPEVDRDGN